MILHGRTFIIKQAGKAIAAAKSGTIEVQTDDIEVAAPSAGRWKRFIAGFSSWKVDVSGLIVTTQADPTADIIAKLRQNGNIVWIEGQICPDTHMYPGLLPFEGWLSSVTVEKVGLLFWPDKISYNSSGGYFVGEKNGKWYNTWVGGEAYVKPSDGAFFHDTEENVVYQWTNNHLESGVEMGIFSGDALCKQVRVTGAVGNLATYAASFLGTGNPNGIDV